MYANALNTTLRETRGIGLATTECTRIDTDHMADEEGIARPERLTRIALGRFSGLRPAFGVQNANAFCRTGVLFFIRSTSNQKGGPIGPPFFD